MTFKLIYCLFVVGFIAAFSELLVFHETKYIGIITFGYLCHIFWKEDKPERALEIFWMCLMPFLFGSVGAAVKIEEIKPIFLAIGLGVFCFGLVFRWFATFFVGFFKDYNCKEKTFCAFAWIPKATVQAAIGGVILEEVRADIPEGELKDEYEDHGLFILATAVIAIVISAPLGSIMTNTFGPKWLTNDKKELGSKMKINPNTGSLQNKTLLGL